MQIELHILLGGATAAVIIVIGFIRLMTGARKPLLNEEICNQFLKDYEPGAVIKNLLFDKRRTAALLETQAPRQYFLIRSFGGKLVHQQLQNNQVNDLSGDILLIPRQGITHPPMNFSFEHNADALRWQKLLKSGSKNDAA